MSLVEALQVCDSIWNRVILGGFHGHYTIVPKQIVAGAFFENLWRLIMAVGRVGEYQVEGPANSNNRQCRPDILMMVVALSVNLQRSRFSLTRFIAWRELSTNQAWSAPRLNDSIPNAPLPA